MKRKTVVAGVCACAMLLGMGDVFAMGSIKAALESWHNKSESWHDNNQTATHKSTQTTTVSAPEIDVGAAPSSIALLVAGILIAAERRRRA